MTPVAVADLSLVKTGSPVVQYVGQNVVFTLTVAKDGPSAASGVTVSDTLPTGYTYVGSAPTNGSYDSGSGLWTLGGLNAGGSAGLVLTATVNAAGNYTNYAQVAHSGEFDPDSQAGDDSSGADDDDTFAVTPVAVVDLQLVDQRQVELVDRLIVQCVFCMRYCTCRV